MIAETKNMVYYTEAMRACKVVCRWHCSFWYLVVSPFSVSLGASSFQGLCEWICFIVLIKHLFSFRLINLAVPCWILFWQEQYLQVWESQLEFSRLPESFNKLCCHDISDTIWRRAITMTELVTKDFDISLKSLLMSSKKLCKKKTWTTCTLS